MPAGCVGRGRLHRLNRTHDRLRAQAAAAARRLVTECSMADNVRVEVPDVEFTQPCNLCPHMKRITLPKILDSLLTMQDEVVVDASVAEKARRAIERMIHLKA